MVRLIGFIKFILFFIDASKHFVYLQGHGTVVEIFGSCITATGAVSYELALSMHKTLKRQTVSNKLTM